MEITLNLKDKTYDKIKKIIESPENTFKTPESFVEQAVNLLIYAEDMKKVLPSSITQLKGGEKNV